MKRRIFISYSTHPDDAAFAKQLEDELTAAGFQVLRDQNIKSSDDWNEEIYEWMAWCHAAVMLLTKNSVQRPWVSKEAGILKWRWSLNSGSFKLFYKIFPGAFDDPAAKRWFDPIRLEQVQSLAANTPAEISGEIAAQMPQQVEATPLDTLAKVLSDILIKLGPNALEDVATKLGVDATKWIPGRTIDQERAEQMTRRLVRQDLGGYGGLHPLLGDLRTLENESRRKFLEFVMPFWVPGEAAGCVCDLSKREGRWALVMNGKRVGKYTAQAYLLRAFLFKDRVGVIPLDGGISEGGEAETIKAIYSGLREILGPIDPEDIPEALEAFSHPIFVILPPAIGDQKALESFQEKFKKIIFVVDAELDEVWAKKIASLPNVARLEPPVDPKVETTRYLDYNQAFALISKTG